MAAVPDASVLITLAKIDRVHLLRQLYGRALIGPIVKHEVVDEGKHVGALGVQRVEQALEEGWVRIMSISKPARQVQERLARTTKLHKGEVEAISIAKAHRSTLIVDDKEARSVAGALGVQYLGTAGVLLAAYRHKHLDQDEFEDAVTGLTRVLWLSPSVVAAILKMAREKV